MGSVFYFAGVVFILEAIRGIITAKKDIAVYKVGAQVPDKNIMNDPEKLKQTMNDLIGELRSQAVPSIVWILYFIWNIYGIFNATEWQWFSCNFSIIVLSGVITGFNDKYRTVPFCVTVNSLCILIMSYILYLHFFTSL